MIDVEYLLAVVFKRSGWKYIDCTVKTGGERVSLLGVNKCQI